MSCASFSSPSLCDRFIPQEEWGWEAGSSLCPSWRRFPSCPRRGCPGSRPYCGGSREDFPCPNTPSREDTASVPTQPPWAKQFWKKGGWQRPRALRLPPSSGGSGPSVRKREDRGLGWCVQNRPQKGKPSVLRFLQPISFNCMIEMIKKKQNIVFVVGWGFFLSLTQNDS